MAAQQARDAELERREAQATYFSSFGDDDAHRATIGPSDDEEDADDEVGSEDDEEEDDED